MGQDLTGHDDEPDDEDEMGSVSDTTGTTCHTQLADHLPQPNAWQLQFIELVAAGNVDQLKELVKKHEVCTLLPII